MTDQGSTHQKGTVTRDGDGRPRDFYRRGPTWHQWPPRGRDLDPDIEGFNAWDDRVRSRQNIAGAIAILLVCIATFWVINELAVSSKAMRCLEAGHRNCMPLDLGRPAGR